MKQAFEVAASSAIASSTTAPALFCTYVYIPNIHPGNIDIEISGECRGSVKIIACIEDQVVIDKPLANLEYKESDSADSVCLPKARVPSQSRLFD